MSSTIVNTPIPPHCLVSPCPIIRFLLAHIQQEAELRSNAEAAAAAYAEATHDLPEATRELAAAAELARAEAEGAEGAAPVNASLHATMLHACCLMPAAWRYNNSCTTRQAEEMKKTKKKKKKKKKPAKEL